LPNGLRVGDTITLETPHGPTPVRIAGTMIEHLVGGNAVYLDWARAKDLLDAAGVHVFLVSAREKATPRLASSLGKFCERRGLLLQSNAEMRQDIDQLLGRVVGVLWVLVVLAFAVASLGIVNTLMMNVFEQTGEFRVLRAVGMERGQIRKVVFSQAVLTGLVSFAPGAVVGCGLAWFLNLAAATVLGQPIAFRINGGLVSGCFLVALVIAIAAALLPARRAARVRLTGPLRP
jgi:putative ABC transport system permease protein